MKSFIAAFLLAAPCLAAVDLWPVDALIKAFPDDTPGTNRTSERTWLIARNGHASIQLAIRSPSIIPELSASITLGGGLQTEIRRVGYVPVHANVPDTPVSELVRGAPGRFPDPLFEGSSFRLPADETTALWITVFAPSNTPPGTYEGELFLTSEGKRIGRIGFRVRVVRATVPAEQTLKVTNWFYFDEEMLSRYFDIKGQPDKTWELLSNVSRVLAAHRQNVFLTPVLSLTDARQSEGRLIYDFSRLDRFVGIVTRAGAMELIEGSHLIERDGGYGGPLKIPGFAAEGSIVKRHRYDADDPHAEAQLDSFLTALYAHLKTKGWLSRYTQHVLDEPHGNEPPVYTRYAKIVRRNLPGVPIIDAFDQSADGWLGEATDIKVLQLGKFDDAMDIVRQHVQRGGQAWYYTCLFPRGRYPNRFIDFPLLKTRLLQWLNFRYDLTGYLHWGANSWGGNPYEVTELGLEVGAPVQGALPPGDAFVTYPSREKNSIYSSIRLESMLEGIEDYELLRKLAATDSRTATALARKVTPGFTEYVRDVRSFRKLHRALLMAGR